MVFAAMTMVNSLPGLVNKKLCGRGAMPPLLLKVSWMAVPALAVSSTLSKAMGEMVLGLSSNTVTAASVVVAAAGLGVVSGD